VRVTRDAFVGRPRMPNSAPATSTDFAFDSSENSFQVMPLLSISRTTGSNTTASATSTAALALEVSVTLSSINGQ